MNLATLTPTPKPEIVTGKKSVKKRKISNKRDKKRDKKSNKKSDKKRDKKSYKKRYKKRHKKSGKKHHRSNPYEYNIQNQINQFYEMTLKYLSSGQKGFLNIVNNSIVFNKGGSGTELYLKNLEEMPWWTFKLADVKQKLPIASPLLVGPLTFKMTFTQADKNAEIERRLTIQNGNIYLIKDYLLNLK